MGTLEDIKNDRSLPDDWREPRWFHEERVHCWRNYVTDNLKFCWSGFEDFQAMAIASALQEIADNEHWD